MAERFYSLYERLWHWLQAVAGLALILSGFSIAFPDRFHLLDFERAVAVHHVFGWLLLANAALALFYNLATGLIRRYLPRLEDVLQLGMHHARYYLLGIFRGEPHPFRKTPERRLLPLQRVTYFIVLNAVLPLLVATGLLQLGADWWPRLLSALGGLPLVATLHRLAAWLFAAFTVLHVYMITIGPRWWTNLKTMFTGYGEVEPGKDAG